jgi:DNA repair protein RadC
MRSAAPDPLPEERLFDCEWENLSDIDLLALLLGPGQPDQLALAKARNLVEILGNLRQLKGTSYAELRGAGLGHKRTLAVLAAVRLARRLGQEPLVPGQGFRSSGEIYNHFRPLVESLKKECFWNVLLDGKNRILKVVRVSEGCLTSSLVHPREVFRVAIAEAAASVIFVHNHPSGDPAPSQEDLHITRRLVETGKIVGIRALDHVIIGDYRYFSFADQGLM